MSQVDMNQDAEHLKLLSIFHYVVGGLLGCCACIPIFHLIFGIICLTARPAFARAEERPIPHNAVRRR